MGDNGLAPPTGVGPGDLGPGQGTSRETTSKGADTRRRGRTVNQKKSEYPELVSSAIDIG